MAVQQVAAAAVMAETGLLDLLDQIEKGLHGSSSSSLALAADRVGAQLS
jgi:hypothetical protein